MRQRQFFAKKDEKKRQEKKRTDKLDPSFQESKVHREPASCGAGFGGAERGRKERAGGERVANAVNSTLTSLRGSGSHWCIVSGMDAYAYLYFWCEPTAFESTWLCRPCIALLQGLGRSDEVVEGTRRQEREGGNPTKFNKNMLQTGIKQKEEAVVSQQSGDSTSSSPRLIN
jgi:hypothetical protein